jgi:hypothetical protein
MRTRLLYVPALFISALLMAGGCSKKKEKAAKEAKVKKTDDPMKVNKVKIPPKKTFEIGKTALPGAGSPGPAAGLVGKNVGVFFKAFKWQYYHPEFQGKVTAVDAVGLSLTRSKIYDKKKYDYKPASGQFFIPWTSIRHIYLHKK